MPQAYWSEAKCAQGCRTQAIVFKAIATASAQDEFVIDVVQCKANRDSQAHVVHLKATQFRLSFTLGLVMGPSPSFKLIPSGSLVTDVHHRVTRCPLTHLRCGFQGPGF